MSSSSSSNTATATDQDEKAAPTHRAPGAGKRLAAEMEAPKYHDSLVIEFLIQRSNEFDTRQQVEDALDELYDAIGSRRKRARVHADTEAILAASAAHRAKESGAGP